MTDLIDIAKSDRRRDQAAALTGAGLAAGTTGLVASGLPVRARPGAAPSPLHGILGWRIAAHEGANRRFEAERKAKASKLLLRRGSEYERARRAGRIAPEREVIEHLKVGRKAGRTALLGGALATAAGVAGSRSASVKKAADDQGRRSSSVGAGLAAAGATTAGISHVGSRVLSEQGRQWSARGADELAQAARIAPGIGGERPKYASDLKRGALRRLRRKKIRRAAALHGAAGQSRYFAHVYDQNAKLLWKVRGGGLAAVAAGVGTKALSRRQDSSA